MRAILLALALAAAGVAAANAQIWIMSPASQMSGRAHGAPPPTGALALEDGTSILLLEDGTSNLCLEGGC